MAYIGNDLEVAFQSYLIIDDISGDFDGIETSFTLNVNGAVPVPFPINPQQCLISVAGVIQEPDPTGSSGFNLSGNNIVFSSAPAGSASFFGVVLAGADYVNVGVDFPAGSVAAPSITFVTDKDTGFFSKAANEIGIACAGTEVGVFSSTGLSSGFADGSAGSPSIFFTSDTNTGIARAAADELIISAGGVERASFGSSEVVFNDPSNDVDFRVESNGNTHMLFVDAGNDQVGIGISTPSKPLHIYQASDAGIRIQNSTTGTGTTDGILLEATGSDGLFWNYESGNLRFATANSERARIDSSGRLLVGATSVANAGLGQRIYVAQTGGEAIANIRYGNNANASYFLLGKSRSTSVNSYTVLQDNDEIGRIQWTGADGTDLATPAASIGGFVDGTPGSNDMPGRLVFSTTADGASSPTERLRIDSSGQVGIGASSPGNTLHLKASTPFVRLENTTGNYTSYIGVENDGRLKLNASSASSTIVFETINSERMRIDSNGRVMIGTTTNNGGALTVDSGGSGNVVIRDNGIENHKHNANSSIAINYNGYANGTTQFRDLDIYNGKQQHIATFDGSTSNFGIGTTGPGAKLQVVKNSTNNTPLSHNYPATQSGIVVDNQQTGTTGAFTAVTLRAYNSSSTLQGASIIAQSTGSGYSANLLFTQRSGSGTQVERMRIQSSGGISFNGDTAAANALDDYEEGTWTPVLQGRTTNGTTTNNRTAVGKYTKIGRLVNVMCDIDATVSGGSGDMQISGLPFAAHSGPYVRFPGSVAFLRMPFSYSDVQITPFVNDGQTVIWFISNRSNTTSDQLDITTNRTEVLVNITYMIS